MANVRGVCNFLGSVSSRQKFEVMDVKALVTAFGQCYSSVLPLSFIWKIHP